jgi:Leucine-rich repeat (LRR) protein
MRFLWAFCFAALTTGFVLAAGHTEPGKLGETPKDEDPDVVAYVKKKGWVLMKDLRISDLNPTVVLSVQNEGKPFDQVDITEEDYKMIARSKTVRYLDIRLAKNTDAGLKIIAGMGQLEGVFVGGDGVTDSGIKELAKCRSLETVTLSTSKVTDGGIKELAALPKLKELHFVGMTLDGSAFEAFAGSKTLESVNLDFIHGLTDDGIKSLAKLPKLDRLNISSGLDSTLTAAGVKAIVDSRLPAKLNFDTKLIDDTLLQTLVAKGWLYGPTRPGSKDKRPASPADVRFIALDSSKVTDKGLQAILNCTNVESLYLERTAVTDETLKKLSGFKKLTSLSLGDTKVTAAGLEAVTGLPIRRLSMESSELTEDAFKAFGKMTALEELGLNYTKMKCQWLKHIAKLPKLKELNVTRTDFDDTSVQYVTSLPSLTQLVLNETKLGDKGFKELVALPKLESLYVDGTGVTRDVYLKAKRDRPKMFLYFYSYDR